MKFKVGDRVRIVRQCAVRTIVSIHQLNSRFPYTMDEDVEGRINLYGDEELELVEPAKEKIMARRTFRLKKNTPDNKKGMLVQEACDNGDQEYISLNQKDFMLFDDWNQYISEYNLVLHFSRNSVEQNPEWFEEVFSATDNWLTQEELDNFHEFVSNKSSKKSVKVNQEFKLNDGPMDGKSFIYELGVGESRNISAAKMKSAAASATYCKKRYGRVFTRRRVNAQTYKFTRVA